MLQTGFLTTSAVALIQQLVEQVARLQTEVDNLKRLKADVRLVQAKLTDVDENGAHTWHQIDFDRDGNPFEMHNGLNGTPEYNPAFERNNAQVCSFPTYVLLAFRSEIQEKGIVWEFDLSNEGAPGSGADAGSGHGCGSGFCRDQLTGRLDSLPILTLDEVGSLLGLSKSGCLGQLPFKNRKCIASGSGA